MKRITLTLIVSSSILFNGQKPPSKFLVVKGTCFMHVKTLVIAPRTEFPRPSSLPALHPEMVSMVTLRRSRHDVARPATARVSPPETDGVDGPVYRVGFRPRAFVDVRAVAT